MKQSVQRDVSQVSKTAEPARSRPAQQKTSASGDHLAQLAAMINASPKAESLMTLAAEINPPVQRLREAGGSESGVNGPAQLRLEVEGTLAHGDRSGNSITENAGGESADTGQSATQASCGCSAKANARSGSGSESRPSKKLPAQKKDAARSQAATQQPAQLRGVLQAVWVYLDAEGGKSLQLKKTADPDVFIGADGSKYEKTGTASDDRIIVKRQGGVHADWRYDRFKPYKKWTKKSQGVSVPAPFGAGDINAAHKRGAPKISSKQEDFGGAKLGDAYSDYVSGLQSGGKTDAEIATALLKLDDTELASDLEQRAASMLHVTVYLAEEWRKQGAAKLYRAFLRSIENGEKDFSDFLTEYKFIVSADEGRKQVARLADVHRGVKAKSDLDADEQIILGNMSPIRDEDVESDSDMEVEKSLKKTRDHSEKNKGPGIGWKDPWPK